MRSVLEYIPSEMISADLRKYQSDIEITFRHTLARLELTDIYPGHMPRTHERVNL